jgi:23S rRNA (cytidine1920-2'-O)/16S rRNA (cytidine1409-2'-O)-methyltransferase
MAYSIVAGRVKERVDKLLVERGLAPSRERARALILAGQVYAGERRIEKAGETLAADAELRLAGEDIPFVSRGGLKLEKAVQAFELEPIIKGAVCVDVGASTGGFTDCLLQHGAARVYAIDVGYGQLAWKLRNDARVLSIERQNIRHLPADAVPEKAALATVDVSFISLLLVLPRIAELAPAIVALVKPQFEVGKGEVGKGGVVREPEKRLGAVEKVAAFCRAQGWRVDGPVESPIEGPAGNHEFLLFIRT